MEEAILKTVTAFLNSDGGILLIGVDDDGNILGLQNDYQTLKKKDRDGFELWLMGDLLLKSLGNDLAPQISVSFGIIETKEVCNVTVQPSPRPSFCEIKNKGGLSEECFFIRAGNQTKHLTKPSEIINYTQTRWS
jgi:predicted HTH transcriptional regulator